MVAKALLKGVARALGYEVTRRRTDTTPDDAIEGEYSRILEAVQGQSMLPAAGMVANLDAVDYLLANDIPGAIVECGVWRGGSMAAMARLLVARGDTERDLYLFDTFAGMTRPTAADVSSAGKLASEAYERRQRAEHNEWAYAPLAEVEETMRATGYPASRLVYVKGDVLETIPAFVAERRPRIALLRLDTDWYESTRVELEHLYDCVVERGVVVVDDYGHWQGARQAVDEYLAKLAFKPLLFRVDYTRRLFLKLGPS